MNRIGIVTGASSGIGRAIAEELLRSGFSLVVNARREERLRELERFGAIAVVPGDAADPSIIAALFEEARRVFKADADLVVVNAGRGLGGAVSDADLSQLEEVVRINLLGATVLLQHSARELTKTPWRGSEDRRDIIVLGSISGRHISPFSAVYGATKFAVNSLAEAARRELGPKGVRVTLLAPAIVLSEFQAGAGYNDEWHREVNEKFGPLLLPEDVARLASFIVQQPAHVHINEVIIRPTRQSYP